MINQLPSSIPKSDYTETNTAGILTYDAAMNCKKQFITQVYPFSEYILQWASYTFSSNTVMAVALDLHQIPFSSTQIISFQTVLLLSNLYAIVSIILCFLVRCKEILLFYSIDAMYFLFSLYFH